jgi:hypothetical protein
MIAIPPHAHAIVQATHGRYQREVIETLNVCPFARRSRELGRVHRPVFVAETDPNPLATRVAQRLLEITRESPDAEIVLHTFLVPQDHAWRDPLRFDAWLKPLRAAWDAIEDKPPWYMVAFHPRPRSVDRLTPDSFVPSLRRSPDPVIQCVNAQTLDEARRQAQETAHQRMLDEARANTPELVPLLERTIAPDPQLSAEIARRNYDSLAQGGGREGLETALVSIIEERARTYAADAFLTSFV